MGYLMFIFFDNHSKLEDKTIKFRAYEDRRITCCAVTMESIRDFYELKDSDTEIITVFAEKRSQFEKLAKSIIEAGEYDNGVVVIDKSKMARHGVAKQTTTS